MLCVLFLILFSALKTVAAVGLTDVDRCDVCKCLSCFPYRTGKKGFVFNCSIDRFSDDITMPIVWFLLQIVVKFAHLNQW